jgi:hypothetical protein
MAGLLERAPDRFGFTEIGDDLDVSDTARFRPRWRFCRPALHRRCHGHSQSLSDKEKFGVFDLGRPLQRSVNKE